MAITLANRVANGVRNLLGIAPKFSETEVPLMGSMSTGVGNDDTQSILSYSNKLTKLEQAVWRDDKPVVISPKVAGQINGQLQQLEKNISAGEVFMQPAEKKRIEEAKALSLELMNATLPADQRKAKERELRKLCDSIVRSGKTLVEREIGVVSMMGQALSATRAILSIPFRLLAAALPVPQFLQDRFAMFNPEAQFAGLKNSLYHIPFMNNNMANFLGRAVMAVVQIPRNLLSCLNPYNWGAECGLKTRLQETFGDTLGGGIFVGAKGMGMAGWAWMVAGSIAITVGKFTAIGSIASGGFGLSAAVSAFPALASTVGAAIAGALPGISWAAVGSAIVSAGPAILGGLGFVAATLGTGGLFAVVAAVGLAVLGWKMYKSHKESSSASGGISHTAANKQGSNAVVNQSGNAAELKQMPPKQQPVQGNTAKDTTAQGMLNANENRQKVVRNRGAQIE